MSIDQTVSAVASIGALLAALATFLTVWQIAKQRRASYRPQIVVSPITFSATATEQHYEVSSLMDWKDVRAEEDKERSEYVPGPFGLHIANIGLGAAANVEFEWEFPVKQFIDKINKFAARANLEVPFKFVETTLSFWKDQKKDQLDYILPAAVVPHGHYSLSIPATYKLLVSAAVCVFYDEEARKLEHRGKLEVPALRLTTTFEDIAAQKHHVRYYISFHLIMHAHKEVGHVERIHATLEPIKAP